MNKTDLSKPLCVHCSQRNITRPRGLCWTCHHNKAIRAKYAKDGSSYGRRGVAEDYHGGHHKPEFPTKAMPGTEEKQQVMQGRAERRESLFHPLDAKGASDD